MLFRVSLAGAVSPGRDLAYQSNLHMPFSPLYLPLFLSLSLSLSHE